MGDGQLVVCEAKAFLGPSKASKDRLGWNSEQSFRSLPVRKHSPHRGCAGPFEGRSLLECSRDAHEDAVIDGAGYDAVRTP